MLVQAKQACSLFADKKRVGRICDREEVEDVLYFLVLYAMNLSGRDRSY